MAPPARSGSMNPPPPHTNGAAPLADDVDEDPDSSNSIGQKRKNRPEINRRVPQQSFAYGAPSDGKRAKPNRSARTNSLSISPEKPALRVDGRATPPLVPQPAPAAARYAALRAQKQTGAKVGLQSGLVDNVMSSPGPRRSARLSVASESVDADNAARRQQIDEIEEDQAEEDSEEDSEGKARKSSVPPPSAEASSSRLGRSRMGTGTQLNSYFMRAPPSNASSGPSEDRRERERMVMTSSLLRGAQRPSHDPLFPRRADGTDQESMRSSDAGESRSYASEEAFVQRHAEESEERDATPPASMLQDARSWIANISPWNRRTQQVNGDAHHEQTERHPERRRPRASRDKTYRPQDNEAGLNDGYEYESDEHGRRSRRRKSDDRARSARGGRDDNRIWMGSKKRRGRRDGVNGTTSEGDTTLEGVDSSGEAAEDGFAAQSTQPTTRRRRMQRAPASTGLYPTLGKLSKSTAARCAGVVLFGLLLASAISPSSEPSSPQSGSRIGRMFTSQRAYTPPEQPPANFDTFVSRLLSLESIVGGLSKTTSSLSASQDHLYRQVAALELSSEKVKSLLDKTDQDGRTYRQTLEHRVKLLDATASNLQGLIEKLEARLASAEKAVDSGAQQKMQDRLSSVQADLKANRDELAKVKASAQSAETVANQARDAMQPLLVANLPEQMPVRLDRKSGKPKIEPWFYEQLKSTFAQQGGTNTGDGASWETLKSRNEAAIRFLISDEANSLIDSRQSSKDGHAILSRNDFLSVLHSELDTMKVTLEKSFNDNAQGMQNDILAKVRAQQAMFEESGSWSSGSKKGKKQQHAPVKAFDGLPSLDQLTTKDGSDPRQSILALIDAALEVYSADRINKADFALYSSGGRVIPSMTSPTWDPLSGSGSSSSWLSWLPGLGESSVTKHLRSRSPVVALHHDNAPGMCWPFAGQTGQLGIHLARKAVVTDITIEHPASTLTFGDSSSAPREVTISALIERPEDRLRLAEYKKQRQANLDAASDDDGSMEMVSTPASSNHLHLASFTYDATSATRGSIQTFPVSAEAQALQIPVSVVQVRVLSNHGEKEYTCLYRVRVHGEAWTEE